jgi:hypothetical protein
MAIRKPVDPDYGNFVGCMGSFEMDLDDLTGGSKKQERNDSQDDEDEFRRNQENR